MAPSNPTEQRSTEQRPAAKSALPPPLAPGLVRRVPAQVSPAGITPLPDAEALRRLVARLTSPDFLDRMRATRELVEMGEAVLPTLAAAGDLLVAGPGGLSMHATRGPIEAILEHVPSERLSAWMAAPSAEVRRAAVAESARRRERLSVPALLARLDDGSPCVRAAAAAALRETTGQWFGFDPDGSLALRQHAAARWRGWWTAEAAKPTGPDDRR